MPNQQKKAIAASPGTGPVHNQPLQAEAKAMTKETLQQTLMDSYEVLQLLHISRGTLYNWRKKGLIMGSKIGGRIYFEVTDIYKMVKERKQKKWKVAA